MYTYGDLFEDEGTTSKSTRIVGQGYCRNARMLESSNARMQEAGRRDGEMMSSRISGVTQMTCHQTDADG